MYRSVDIMITAHVPQILDSYVEFIKIVVNEFKETGIELDGISTPRLHKDTWITNKSPFIYGRHKIEYEVRSYKKV